MTYTSARLVEAEIRATTAFSSDTSPSLQQVNDWIDEESKIIDTRTNSVFSQNVASSVYFDYDGEDVFRLPQSPVISITKVEYNVNALGTSPSWVTLEEGFDKNYIVYEDEGELEFISGLNAAYKIKPKSGKKRLRLSYIYGYESVPLDIQRLATLAVGKRVISSLLHTQANTQGGNIQVGTISVSDPSNYGVSWFKNVNDEIQTLYDNLGLDFKTFRLSRRY